MVCDNTICNDITDKNIKIVYKKLSENRKADIKEMDIVNPYGEYFVPRIKLSSYVARTEDEKYILERIDGDQNFYEEHPGEKYYLFVCKDKFYWVIIPVSDFIGMRNHPSNPDVDSFIIRIPKLEEIRDDEIPILVSLFRECMQSHSRLDEGSYFAKCRIYYDNKLMLAEF